MESPLGNSQQKMHQTFALPVYSDELGMGSSSSQSQVNFSARQQPVQPQAPHGIGSAAANSYWYAVNQMSGGGGPDSGASAHAQGVGLSSTHPEMNDVAGMFLMDQMFYDQFGGDYPPGRMYGDHVPTSAAPATSSTSERYHQYSPHDMTPQLSGGPSSSRDAGHNEAVEYDTIGMWTHGPSGFKCVGFFKCFLSVFTRIDLLTLCRVEQVMNTNIRYLRSHHNYRI